MTTRRVISVWLPDWRTDRLQRRRPELREKLLVLIRAGKGGDRIVAVNAVARERGLAPQMALADARAIAPGLTSLAHDAETELLELEALARWCGRYSPLTAADPPDGLWLDVTGAAHLFGGETALLKAVQADMSRMGLACRAAIADTPGAAWALARFGSAAPAGIPPGAQKEHLAALPVAGLRLAPETRRQLERLGLKHIGQLYEIAPAALRSRFGVAVPQRLAQALGREKEPISPLLHEPAYYATLRLGEPVGTLSDVEAAIDILAARVTGRLTAHGKGARRFTLTLYGPMGGRFPLAVGTSRLTSDAAHVKRLFRERLAALENRFDAVFGADAFSLQAEGSGALVPHQGELGGAAAGTAETAILIDRLQARLGRDAVLEFACRESHVP
ncbi:MAG: DNA polymerase Y family protein, partial [Alphaproteobacteria bacterium]